MQGLKISGSAAGMPAVSVVASVSVFLVDMLALPFWISPVVICAALIIMIFLYRHITNSAKQYSRDAAEAVRGISKGAFNPRADEAGDDELINALSELSGGLKKFTDDLSRAAKKQASGGAFAPADDKAYEGAFKEAVKNVNAVYASYSADISGVAAGLRNLAAGDIRNSLSGFTGGKADVNAAMENLTENIRALLSEIQNTQQALTDGRLSYQADAAKLEGGWARAAGQLNDAVTAAATPVRDLQAAAERLRLGDFSPVPGGGYKGDYYKVSQSLSQAANTVAAHNKELLAVLDDFAAYTPGRGLRREYGGAVPGFKQAVSGAAKRLEELAANGAAQEKPKPVHTPPAPKAAGTATNAVRSAGTAANAVRPAPVSKPDSALKPAAVKPAPVSKAKEVLRADAFVSANPGLGQRTFTPPSAAKVYDAKDFGKY